MSADQKNTNSMKAYIDQSGELRTYPTEGIAKQKMAADSLKTEVDIDEIAAAIKQEYRLSHDGQIAESLAAYALTGLGLCKVEDLNQPAKYCAAITEVGKILNLEKNDSLIDY